MALLTKNGFIADPWRHLVPGEDIPAAGHVILPLADWQTKRKATRDTSVPLGVRIEPGFVVDSLVEDLPRLALIALDFPKYTDGRAFSMAHRLRGFLAFEGELRAVGDVLFDQLQLMLRCGFDSFEISDPATLRLLEAGRRPGVERFYQPGVGPEPTAGTRPWLRQRVGRASF